MGVVRAIIVEDAIGGLLGTREGEFWVLSGHGGCTYIPSLNVLFRVFGLYFRNGMICLHQDAAFFMA